MTMRGDDPKLRSKSRTLRSAVATHAARSARPWSVVNDHVPRGIAETLLPSNAA
eukprot:CAMPEP_0172608752 /NCGR_PEP_ID=MMETSP1068-20121228/28820_1 /TAXON_ID=35684 /ORGANISM="Pseudopedinella elastica, Strain CCMP716" /LENGTH=53 /DNA_ID=CAMNT_0013412097 /DNA_START=331 /DNA_END=489 /DNA_ORIENTATION=-